MIGGPFDFALGVVLGASLGVAVMAILAAGRDAD